MLFNTDFTFKSSIFDLVSRNRLASVFFHFKSVVGYVLLSFFRLLKSSFIALSIICVDIFIVLSMGTIFGFKRCFIFPTLTFSAAICIASKLVKLFDLMLASSIAHLLNTIIKYMWYIESRFRLTRFLLFWLFTKKYKKVHYKLLY